MTDLTNPQRQMLDLLDKVVVRNSRNRDRFIIDGVLARPHETRVITALQEKGLVRWESQAVALAGHTAPKQIMRLVRKTEGKPTLQHREEPQDHVARWSRSTPNTCADCGGPVVKS